MTDLGQSVASPIEALWECYLLSGADPSPYTTDTRTERGRTAGFLAFSRDPNHLEAAVDAVRELRADYDEVCEEASRSLRERAEDERRSNQRAGSGSGYDG